MINKVKIQITEDEWAEFPKEKRERTMELMKLYGYDTKTLEALERETEQTVEDVYRQFYGEEE